MCGPNGQIDARPDAPPCSGVLVGGDLLSVCIDSTATETFLTSSSIDTDNDPRCNLFVDHADPALCTIVGTTLMISGNVIATGKRPLVLAAEGTIQSQLGISIDVASRGTTPGAGGNWDGCDLSMIDGSNNGGGAGGSYQGKGGGSVVTVISNAGKPAMALLPGVHGGCPGGRNGNSSGGAGGGAIYFAAQTVLINGDVIAFGGGGTSGSALAGGAGGGSGGFIEFDAGTVSLGNTVAIVASGGGGGGGGGSGGSAAPGSSGASPMAPTWVGGFGAGGNGPGAGNGGDGGDGSPGGAIHTGDVGNQGTDSLAGSGGGGGGAGYIRVRPGTMLSLGTGNVITPSP
jgi:hypothetical protein